MGRATAVRRRSCDRDLVTGHAGLSMTDGIPQVMCLPELIRELDGMDCQPQTLAEAEALVPQWRARERELHLGKIGEVASLWITPQDILTIVRTKRLREAAALIAKRHPKDLVARVRERYLAERRRAEPDLAVVRRISKDVPEISEKRLYGLVIRCRREWLTGGEARGHVLG